MSRAQVERLIRLIREGGVGEAEELYYLLERGIPELNSSLKKSRTVLADPEDPDPKQVSRFLEVRVDALRRIVQFFSGGGTRKPSRQRLATFAAQVQFWEWELETVYESFREFRLRARVWDSDHTLFDLVRASGLCVRSRIEEDVKRDIRWRDRWFRMNTDPVEAPMGSLRTLVEEWNELVRRASRIFIEGDGVRFQERHRTEVPDDL